MLLVGYFGRGNAGDEWIRRRMRAVLVGPTAEIPDASGSRVRRAGAAWGALRGASGLVFGGGEIFQRRSSLRSWLYYAALAWTARLLRRPVFAYGIALDPRLGRFQRRLTAWVLRGAWVTARDAASAAALGAPAVPDSVWACPAPRAAASSGLRRVLWILRFPPGTDYERLADGLNALSQGTGWSMGFLSMQPPLDAPGLGRLRARLNFFHRLEPWEDPDEIFARVAAYDLVVSARYHGLVAAALAGRAAAAFPGYGKTEGLAGELRLGVLGDAPGWAAALREAFAHGPAPVESIVRAARAALEYFSAAAAPRGSSKNVK